MKTIKVNLRVQNVRTFTNAEGRQYINLITVERFPKRKADKETGEIVESDTNELILSLKQFMHVVYLTPNFLQVYFKDFDRKEYTVTPDGVWYSLLLGATISVTIERYEDGDVFVNEISGEEEASDGISYHTRLNTIKLAACGRKFALRKEDDYDAVEQTILELQGVKPEVHKFVVPTEKPAEKAAEKPAEQMNARVGEKSPALVIHCTLTTKTIQVDYNKVTRVDNKKETNSAYRNQNTYKTFYKLYKTSFIDIANDNECIT